jgi:hypothetical protein
MWSYPSSNLSWRLNDAAFRDPGTGKAYPMLEAPPPPPGRYGWEPGLSWAEERGRTG